TCSSSPATTCRPTWRSACCASPSITCWKATTMTSDAVISLNFFERSVPLVLDGSKQLTIRRKSAPAPQIGARIELRYRRTHVFARATVLDVVPFRLIDAPYWARLDGQPSASVLVRELRSIYGGTSGLI